MTTQATGGRIDRLIAEFRRYVELAESARFSDARMHRDRLEDLGFRVCITDDRRREVEGNLPPGAVVGTRPNGLPAYAKATRRY